MIGRGTWLAGSMFSKSLFEKGKAKGKTAQLIRNYGVQMKDLTAFRWLFSAYLGDTRYFSNSF